MKKALLAVLSLSIGLGISYVINHDTLIFLESQKTYTQKLPAFHSALLNLDQASVVFKTGKDYRITYQTTAKHPKNFFCEKGYFSYDDEADHYQISKMIIEAPKKSLKWILTVGTCTLDGVNVAKAELKDIDNTHKIKDSHIDFAIYEGATVINSNVNRKYYKNQYHKVSSND